MKPAKQEHQGAAEECNPAGQLAGLNILIVEDMGMIAIELGLMLDKLGCRTAGVASRLQEAANLARTIENLDGVLLDLNLSGEDSYLVAEILHERGIPLIIMSGYDSSHIRADCAQDAYLQKPFGHADLAAMMLQAFLPARTTSAR
jgi:CheY-like chemotaxis protein